jgi:hypothetical protein
MARRYIVGGKAKLNQQIRPATGVKTGGGAVGFGGKPGIPLAPAQTPAPTSTTTQAAPVDPRDAAYYNAIAKLQFQANQGLANLDQQDAYATTDLQNALGRLHAQQPIAQQNTENTANAQGLFYSGQLGSRLGALNTQYAQQEGDINQNAQRAQAARAAARNAIQQGLPIDTAAALAAAVDRQGARDAANPPQDITTTTPAPAPAAAPAVPRQTFKPPKPRQLTTRPRTPSSRLVGKLVSGGYRP